MLMNTAVSSRADALRRYGQICRSAQGTRSVQNLRSDAERRNE
jgi:hypothetical protein